MDAVSEQDLELLDEHLDGALSPEEVDRVRTRLAREPGLAAALADLEAERAARSAGWASLEPDDKQASAFARRVSVAARRQETWSHVGRYARFGSAAAACMLLGYFVGWAGQDGPGSTGPGRGPGDGAGINQVGRGGDGADRNSARSAGRYRVPVGFDETGRPITQDFDTLDEAQRFAEEVRKLQDLRQDPVIIQEQL